MQRNMTQKKTNFIPQRTCVACRGKRLKQDLLRIVRQIDQTLAVDTTHTMQGRGMYLCKNLACITKAQKIQAVKRHLKIADNAQIWDEAVKAIE